MAIISIPTSVSGVNIPGSIFGGPLGSLYAKPGVEFVKYPRDLESSTKSHVVLFTIKEIQEISLEELTGSINKTIDSAFASGSALVNDVQNIDFSNLTTRAYDAVKQGGTNLVEGVTKLASADVQSALKSVVNSIPGLIKDGGEQLNKFTQFASSRRTEIKAYISLYMPENVSFQYDPTYDDTTTLTSVAGATPIIGRAVSSITNILENEALKFLLNKAGYVFNPQAQMLFRGINFRTFNMNFTFTPYSKKEAEDVNKIIKLLRSHAAPRKVTSAGGMFFIPPSIFGIEFKFNGTDNSYLNKVADCVIENIDVNYTPNGWSAHADGAPVQTTVSITFKEIALIDREKIEKEGY